MDYCFLNDSGYAMNIVRPGVDPHWEMILKARELRMDFFERLVEYYDDGLVGPEEFAGWLAQIHIMQEQDISPDLKTFLQELEGLIQAAGALGKPVHALAD